MSRLDREQHAQRQSELALLHGPGFCMALSWAANSCGEGIRTRNGGPWAAQSGGHRLRMIEIATPRQGEASRPSLQADALPD